MRISVRTVCRNMYKQLRETKKIQRTPGRACVVCLRHGVQKKERDSHQAPEN
jgi:hypothetical protein